MTFDVDVKTKLPDDQFKFLHAIATRNHTTVGALVAEMVRRSLESDTGPVQKRPYVRVTPKILNELVRLYEQGNSDEVIARTLGISATSVQTKRRRLGLPARVGKGSRSSALSKKS